MAIRARGGSIPARDARRTCIWPNTFHYGIGIEANITETAAPLAGVGIGLELEANVFTHSLGLALRDEPTSGSSTTRRSPGRTWTSPSS